MAGKFGRRRLADELLLGRAVDHIKRLSPERPIRVLTFNPRDTERLHLLPTVRSYNPFACIKAVWNAKVVVFTGALLEDVTGFTELIFSFVLTVLCRILFTPIVFAGIGYGPFTRGVSSWLARWILQSGKAWYIREGEVPSFIGDRHGSWTGPDPLFFYKIPPVAEPLKKRQLNLGVSLKRFATSRYLGVLASLLIELKKEYRINVVYLPFELPKKIKLLEGVSDRFNLNLMSKISDLKTIYAVYDRMDIVLTSNIHAIILAVQKSVPFIAIRYDDKIGLLAENTLPQNVLAPEKVTAKSLREAILRVTEARHNAAETLRPYAEATREKAVIFDDFLREYVLS